MSCSTLRSSRYLVYHLIHSRASVRSFCTSTPSPSSNRSRLSSYLRNHPTSNTPVVPPVSVPSIQKRIPEVTGPLPSPEILCAHLSDAHGAVDCVLLDVRSTAPFTDWLVVCEGKSERHVKAIADGLKMDMRKIDVQVDGDIVGICGRDSRDWKAVDLGYVVVHVMTGEMRNKYDLEGLWKAEQ